MKRRNTDRARALRQSETDAEKLLWSGLRNRQMDGWRFKRQVTFDPYILDFFCSEALLAVEVDGSQHADVTADHDRRRSEQLAKHGVRVIRFWNVDVLKNLNGVLEAIYLELGQRPSPSPGPPRTR